MAILIGPLSVTARSICSGDSVNLNGYINRSGWRIELTIVGSSFGTRSVRVTIRIDF